jgi:hypothetical protein
MNDGEIKGKPRGRTISLFKVLYYNRKKNKEAA